MAQHRLWSSHLVLVAYGLMVVVSLGSFAAATDLTITDESPELFLIDTSPAYTWEIDADSQSFEIVDASAGTTPLTILRGAPQFSLFVSAHGRIGFGTPAPAANLHLKTTDIFPTLRLESGNPIFPYIWDLEASSAGFLLVDQVNGFNPVFIEAGAKTGSLHVDFASNVGFGTDTPAARIHVRQASQPLVAETVARFEITDDLIGKLEIRNGSTTDGIFHPRLRGTAGSQAVPLTFEGQITTDSGTNPVVAYDAARQSGGTVVTRPLVVYRNNGVSQVSIGPTGVVTATSFNPVSSRAVKHDIEDLDSQEAANALRQLVPVKYSYNDDQSNQKRVGFIAEDVPEVVAAPDRRSVPIMDVVALVTRVVKDQQQTIVDQTKTIEQQKLSIEQQQETNDQQQKSIAELMKRLQALESLASAAK